jgi:hypothetical protein
LSTLCNNEEESPYSRAPEIDFSEEFKSVETDDLGDSFVIENADDDGVPYFDSESEYDGDEDDIGYDDNDNM